MVFVDGRGLRAAKVYQQTYWYTHQPAYRTRPVRDSKFWADWISTFTGEWVDDIGSPLDLPGDPWRGGSVNANTIGIEIIPYTTKFNVPGKPFSQAAQAAVREIVAKYGLPAWTHAQVHPLSRYDNMGLFDLRLGQMFDFGGAK
jgi:hypothetical protein